MGRFSVTYITAKFPQMNELLFQKNRRGERLRYSISNPNPSLISLQEFLYDIANGIAVNIEVRGRIRRDRNTISIDGLHRDVVY